MSGRPRAWALALALSGLAVLAEPWPPPTRADTANPEPFELTQPDGTRFRARLFGGPWVNGHETLDGYTILKDGVTGYWKYADKTAAGALIPSAYTVGRDLPSALPPKLKPDPLAGGTGTTGPPGLSAALGGPGTELTAAPQLGSRPTLVILVEFLDRRSQTTPASWAQRFFGASSSVRDFYGAASYGQFLPAPASESHGTASDGVVGWLLLNRNHPNPGAATGDANKQITRDALIAADPFVNFAQYDTNGDGQISADELLIVIIVAGNETSFGSACSPSVWGHRWSIFGNVTAPTLDGKVVGGLAYAQFGEMHCTTANPPGQQATIGIMVHELGHLLGLPDLYDTDQSSNGVGNWSVMGGGSWNSVSRAGDSPSLMDPWSKFFLSWLAPTPVTGTLANQAIPAAAASATAFQLRPGTPTSGEYFLVENRQRTGYDTGLPGAGLLIWHIDAGKDGNREECIPGGSPACTASVHYQIAVVQADNGFDLERAADRGDAGDPFPGTTSNRAFTDTTAPSSRLYSGAASGASVTAISDSGPTMTATLALGGSAAPTLSVTPGSQDFGTVTVGTTVDRAFTVQNTGGGALSGSATTAAPFSIVSGGAYTLAAGASQTVTVRFTPTSATTFSGSVTFGVTGGAAVTRLVSGVGQAGAALSVTPGSQDFGTVTVGATADRAFTVQNTGAGTLTGSATTAAPFSVVSGGAYSLSAGVSQTVVVRFSPAAASPASGTVTFSVGGGAPVTRGVTGVGATSVTCAAPITPGVAVNGSLVDGDCASLNRSPSRADRYTFSGAAGQPVTITMRAPTPSFVDTFVFLMDPGGVVVASSDDCIPQTDLSSCINGFALPVTGTFTIEATSFDGAARGAYTLTLTTTTVGPALTVTPASQDFGTVTVGTVADRTFTVQNTGSGTLTGSATTAAPFGIVSGGAYSLGAGASQTVTVRFTPTAASPASGGVTFGGAGSVTRTVTGTGAASPSCSGPITPGVPVSGTLADADCVSLNRPPARADRFTFAGAAGQIATITMQAPVSFVDTYVYLLGPDGAVAFANDDCNHPADLSSCLNGVVLPVSGTYTIEATSFDASARGAYTLSLALSSGPVLAVTPAAQDFGTIAAGTTADRTFTVQNTGSGTLTGSATTAAPFSVVAGGSYSLGAGASQSVAVRFSPTGAGAFPGTVTFSSSAGSPLTRPVTGSAGSIPCTTAPITPGTAVSGTLGDTDCDAPNRPGARADRYSFTATAGQRATVNMTSPAFDSYVFLVGPTGSVLAFNDDCPGLHTLDSCILDVPLATAGTYVLEASAYAAAGRGSYTLLLQVATPGGCTFTVSPLNPAAGAAGGTGTLAVTAAAGCAWTATSGAAFVTITGGASGSGNGTVAYAVAANPGAGTRTGTLTVAGQSVTLTQTGQAAQSDRLGDFVTGLYESILSRAPSAGELTGWKDYLQAHPDSTGASGIIHTFFDGPEYAARAVTPESHVRLLYDLLLGRAPEAAGLAGWVADLLRRFEPALDAFIDSPEFQARVAGTASRAALDALVARFYTVVLGRTGSASEIASWSDYVIATGDYRGAAKAFFESPEYNGHARALADHVGVLYRTFLDRSPEAGAVTPWVNYLVQQRGSMADTFILSPEFQQIFHGLFP